MRLYTYFRSSTAYRVRIALNLKGIAYDALAVHLVRDGGEQHRAEYRAINPAGLVPTLEVDGGQRLHQSLAIIEYLEEAFPQTPLLPPDALTRARVRAFALTIACEVHPLNNLRVLTYLTGELGLDDARKSAWYRHWVETGLAAAESMLADVDRGAPFCFGDTPTLADACLVPQMYNAERFGCDLEALPRLTRITERCRTLDAFRRAAPENQPDAAG